MCAKVAGLVLKVLSDLLGHENHEVLRQCCLPWVDWGTVMVGDLGACDLSGKGLALGRCCI